MLSGCSTALVVQYCFDDPAKLDRPYIAEGFDRLDEPSAMLDPSSLVAAVDCIGGLDHASQAKLKPHGLYVCDPAKLDGQKLAEAASACQSPLQSFGRQTWQRLLTE